MKGPTHMNKKNSQPSLELEYWPISDLVPYDRNPRLHSPGQVKQIASSSRNLDSITRFLWIPKRGSLPAMTVWWRQRNWSSAGFRWWFWITSQKPKTGLYHRRQPVDPAGAWDEQILSEELKSLAEQDINLKQRWRRGFPGDGFRQSLTGAEVYGRTPDEG